MSRREVYSGRALEIGKVTAGHYWIEGREVVRQPDGTWLVTYLGSWVTTVATLREAKTAVALELES